MTYELTPGTAAYRIVGWLEAQGRTKEFNSAQIAYALHLDAKGLPTQLAPALQAGIVFRRQKDSSSPRAPFWYSLTDHGAVHRREFRPAPKDWMQPINRKDAEESGSSPGTPGTAGTPAGTCASSAEVAAADAPSGDKGAAADADRAAAPALDTSAPGSQQVLKAEAARPDATDRETPDTASPGVGPMGAGQPADAGPTCEDLRSGGGGARPAAAGCTGRASSPLIRGPLPGRHSQDAGVATGPLHHQRPVARLAYAADEQSAYRRQEPACTGHQSAAQQGNLNPVTDAVEPAAPAALPLHEQRREVDEQFAASLRAAMDFGDDDDALARGAELGRREDHLPAADLAATRRAVHAPPVPAPLAFRAARFSDGTLATERDGIVVAVYSAAEVDAIQKLLGART